MASGSARIRPCATRAAFELWFVGQRDPGQPEAIAAILEGRGHDAGACIERARSDEVRAQYAHATDRAREIGVFGSPTFMTRDGEIFWGDDRLEGAIDWALVH